MAHNGGRVSIHPDRRAPFINQFKRAINVAYDPAAPGTFDEAASKDIYGYPTALPSGSTYKGAFEDMPLDSEYSGNWVLRWSGSARIAITGVTSATTTVSDPDTLVTSNSDGITVEGADGRVVFSVNGTNDGFWRYDIDNLGTPPPSDLLLCQEDHEALWDAGQYFEPRYLSLLKTLRPYSIRHLNTQGVNSANATRSFAERYTVDHFLWSYAELNPVHNCGTAVKSGADYSVNAYAGQTSLVNMDYVHVYFDEAATVKPSTLSVGSFGARDIYDKEGNGEEVISNLPIGWHTFIYDEHYDVWIRAEDHSTRHGWPMEAVIQLHNETGSHCWFQYPHTINKDSINSYASYIANNLDSTLNSIHEWSNEVWSPDFEQTIWHAMYGAIEQGTAYGFQYFPQMYMAYALNAVDMADRVAAAFAGAGKTNYKIFCGLQHASGAGNQIDYKIADSNDYFSGPAEPKPYESYDYIGGATYFVGRYFQGREYSIPNGDTALQHWNIISAAADNFEGTETEKRQAFQAIIDDLNTDFFTTKPNLDTTYDGVANTYGLKTTSYEGGIEVSWPSVSELQNVHGQDVTTAGTYNGKLETLILAYRNSHELRRDYFGYFNDYFQNADAESAAGYIFLDEQKESAPWGIIPSFHSGSFNGAGRAIAMTNNRGKTDRLQAV